MTGSQYHKLKALVGFSDEWMRRSMETVFEEKGYAVTRIGAGKEALRLARQGSFDVIVLDERLEQLSGIDVCIALRDDPLFDHATPIFIVSSAHSSSPSRAAAYAAGCWDYCHQPLDVAGLFLKLTTFLRARRQLAEHASKSAVDPSSGLYTELGRKDLYAHLEARAVRNHEAIACLAFAFDRSEQRESAHTTEEESTAFADLTNALRSEARRSDVLATRGHAQLALLAPETDADGARLLVARLQRALDTLRERGRGSGARLRCGVCAVSDLAVADIHVHELIDRAEHALAYVRTARTRESFVSFDDLPV